MPTTAPHVRTALRDELVKAFSLEDLELLCFDLDIDPENWSRSGKPVLAQNLLNELVRARRTDELLVVLREKRPNVAWPSLDQDPDLPAPPRPMDAPVDPKHLGRISHRARVIVIVMGVLLTLIGIFVVSPRLWSGATSVPLSDTATPGLQTPLIQTATVATTPLPNTVSVAQVATAPAISSLPSPAPLFTTPIPFNDDQGVCVFVLTTGQDPDRPGAHKLACDCSGAGWCGIKVPLNQYDTRGKTTLALWLRGERGGEQARIGIKDIQTEKGQETKVTHSLTTTWSLVSVSLRAFKMTGHTTATLDNLSVSLEFQSAGKGAFYLDSFTFETR